LTEFRRLLPGSTNDLQRILKRDHDASVVRQASRVSRENRQISLIAIIDRAKVGSVLIVGQGSVGEGGTSQVHTFLRTAHFAGMAFVSRGYSKSLADTQAPAKQGCASHDSATVG
jgi:hypothetical protein